MLFGVFLLVAISCSKNTNPKRFHRIITETKNWRLGRAYINDSIKTGNFSNYLFRFYSSQSLEIIKLNEDTVVGSWSQGDDKDPLLFYMNIPLNKTKFLTLDDDWIVTSLTSDEFKLKRNDGSTDEIIFRKKE
jgi:hypothetical protein